MGSKLPFMLALFTVAVVVSHAALTPELYWKMLLPATSMPKAIKESLNPELIEDKSTSVTVGKGGVDVDAGKGKPGGNTNVNVGHGHVGVTTGKPGKGTTVGVGKGGVSVGTGGYKGKGPVVVHVKPKYGPFDYNYAATETQLKDDPNVALFFLEKDLVPGKTMDLQFTKTASPASFLPRKVADSIPFSSRDFTNILNQFSINPKSEEANIMRQTITECEQSGLTGEQKYCATSLESMIDFSTKILGKKNIKAVSTESNEDSQIKKYKIEDSVSSLIGDEENSVVCHKQDYVYAVFYCHSTTSTKAYTVPLKSEDGTEVKAVAVCHKDTSKWNPKHLAFQVLKVKPGTVPVCHFLPDDHVVWYRNQK